MRYILHSDLNNFYASVECLYNPSIRNKAVVVVGDEEKRHGIVLAKNYTAKKYGIATGDTVYEARRKCGEPLVTVKVNFDRYIKVSKIIKDVYREYSNRVESFGIDEAWIDITDKVDNFDQAYALAEEIRMRIVNDFGLTVSIGVSYNKVFAKLGSDLKKPNATTLISDTNYKQLIYPLPVEDLLYVGRATTEKLHKNNVFTIGQLAECDDKFLTLTFGKVGQMLKKFALGQDDSEVKLVGAQDEIKSIGNSTTCPKDLNNNDQVKSVIYVLAESVAKRMRAKGLYCGCVQLWIRDEDLDGIDRQKMLISPTNLADDIATACYQLFVKHYDWHKNVRALGVRALHLTRGNVQCNLFEQAEDVDKKLHLEQAVESLRDRFGYNIIHRASVAGDVALSEINPMDKAHTVHPVGFMNKPDYQ